MCIILGKDWQKLTPVIQSVKVFGEQWLFFDHVPSSVRRSSPLITGRFQLWSFRLWPPICGYEKPWGESRVCLEGIPAPDRHCSPCYCILDVSCSFVYPISMKVYVPEVMEIVLVKCEKRRKNLSVGELGCERMGWFKVRGHFYINL